ncbi:hypothetical protein ACFQ45_05085 [Rhodanobacter aciditrophus]|uniref:GspL cytoplasmic actin-ATPase-like domain-containing protein n=1 Tax=Rhodanobacter aciditrophus TaxID=1623218 RepID=A0ABW4AZW2_9GAMM
MPLRSRPYILAWRSQSWQLFIAHDGMPPSTPQSSDTATILSLLNQLPVKTQKKCRGIALPTELAKVYSQQIDHLLPCELYPLAAQTFAEDKAGSSAGETVVSSWVTYEPLTLHFAVMPWSLFDDLQQATSLPLFSEAMFYSPVTPRVLERGSPFAIFQADFLERQEHAKAKRRLYIAALLIVLITTVIIEMLKQDTPVELAFTWPWTKPQYQEQTFEKALSYVRALPSRVRVDRIQISRDQVLVEVTGVASDLKTWKQHWSSDLPPLELQISPPEPEGGKQ